MARTHSAAAPKYRKVKRTGMAAVTPYDQATGQRKEFPLGKHDTAASKRLYDRGWTNAGPASRMCRDGRVLLV